jgi:hypothetical protein
MRGPVRDLHSHSSRVVSLHRAAIALATALHGDRDMRALVLAIVVFGCGSGSLEAGDDQPGGGSGDDEVFAACKRVDIVIAVDNSGSMSEEKAALRDIAFPGFASSLIGVAGGLDDFRVGVIDACNRPANFHTQGLGGACNFHGGSTWIDSSSPALVDEFKCVGDIDSSDMQCSGSNDDEQPASAAADALQPGANDGFLRPDALLVVVAITDEDEQPVPDASTQAVYDRLVAIKGDVRKLVFLGIGGASSCAGAYGDADEATRLRELTDLFIADQRGVFWDLCQGRLDEGLTQALAVIESACEDFGPLL